MDGAAEREWVVLLPVKAVAGAKSRLQPAFDSPARLGALVEAMRRDTLAAVTATPHVVAVVAAVDAADSAAGLEAAAGTVDVVVQDAPGLNAALRAADAYARDRHPGAGRIAVVGDLPALTPAGLHAVLVAAAGHPRSYVPDLEGSGTTMLAVTAGGLDPAFGPGSAARHGRDAVALPAEAAARHDVDVPDDLRHPPASGFGPHTRGVLDGLAVECAPGG